MAVLADDPRYEAARLYHLETNTKQLAKIEEAIQKNHGYAVTNGPNDLKRCKQRIRFWSNRDGFLEWAAKNNYQPQVTNGR